ncbi:unnamed protein product [Dibothriocephalus latus]|uniref:Uncharacterized protein n=1 Tax=Dibothriocephalus latus TaxID=60516 RepID=A0A3P6VCI2_DIBLA|nr:unnamed protein product [Dibothriocephalus latus]
MVRQTYEDTQAEVMKMQAENMKLKNDVERVTTDMRSVEEAKAQSVHLQNGTKDGQRKMVSLTRCYETLQGQASKHSAKLNEATDSVTNLRRELQLKRSEAGRLAETANVIRSQLELGYESALKQAIDAASARLCALLQDQIPNGSQKPVVPTLSIWHADAITKKKTALELDLLVLGVNVQREKFQLGASTF